MKMFDGRKGDCEVCGAYDVEVMHVGCDDKCEYCMVSYEYRDMSHYPTARSIVQMFHVLEKRLFEKIKESFGE